MNDRKVTRNGVVRGSSGLGGGAELESGDKAKSRSACHMHQA